ncbi:alpha-ribazole phosphatase family protein [Marivita sp. S6314]|uniref:alpha-ribazole phosphatase family protein n=1 Tax=Marivita sp. S6314 TaxID=2926406 RepID=UPI001FF1058D|nr:alpha-ribazole phosphatase family protein [Marivita sp. S6314]MCK0150933.1 alpha-ribazole phosphatase family protein [Marivita sp. S6314]
MAVTLIRHTTPDVTKGTCYGRTDLALADSFAEEAAQVLAGLPEARHVLTSPLTRCHRLAHHIAPHLMGEIQVANHWIEMDFGNWEGVPWSDIPRDQLDAWADDFHRFAGHGGESVAMLERRVRQGLDATPDGAIVVTHAGCIKAACAIFDLENGWDTEVPFGGMITLP